MSDDDLKRLKDLAVPRPSARARSKALAAAAAAFAGGDDEKDEGPKGNVVELRQTHMTSKPARRNKMRFSRSAFAVAASLLVAAVSVPFLVHFLRSDTTSRIVSKSPAPAGARLAMNKAKKDQPVVQPSAASKTNAPDQGTVRSRRRLSEIDAKSATPEPSTKSESDYRRKRAARKLLFDRIFNRQEKEKPASKPKAEASKAPLPDENAAAEAFAPSKIVPGPLPKLGADRIRAAGRANTKKRRWAKRRERSRPGRSRPARRPAYRRRRLKKGAWERGDYLRRRSPGISGLAAPSAGGRIASLRRRDPVMPRPPAYAGRDKFENVAANPVKTVASNPVSTFSVDVDTASYAFMRRALNAGRLPQKNAVRVEELINYFSYDYALPESAAVPFNPTVTVLPSPWNPQNKLVHIAIKGYALRATERPRANLVFLIDVSGSMRGRDRLPLVKNAFRMLLGNLKPDDTVAIVTYASRPGVALQPTKLADKAKIIAAIDGLGAGGSTAGAGGIQNAYTLAEANFDKTAVNRIILATDGDFNVGISDRNELKSYIERKRKSGIFLSILGVGRGNYNDALMQALAQNGNGTAAYIDTLGEARKVLVEEAASTLFPIAKDVKIQIEFNPARISHYRLIGYETRALKRQDFNNDKVDAGDVGSGHAVTAIYEVTPVGADVKLVDDLRYAKPAAKQAAATPDPNAEFGFLKLRYKLPKEDKSRLIKLPIAPSLEKPDLQSAAIDVRFSTAVAAFGQLLRGGTHMGKFSYDDVIALALGAKGTDAFGARAEFINLVRLAKSARP